MMNKLFSIGVMCILAVACSHVGNIDRSKIPGKTTYKLNTGQEVTLPLQYKNWKWMMATYTVPLEQIEEMLPTKLKPILITPGRALISFGVLEYPDVTTLNSYNEWLISIPVQYDPDINIPFLPLTHNPLFPHGVYKKNGSYIYYLPVTTEESRQVGSEIWGFPKVYRQIKCTEEETTKTCNLLNNDKVEMSLQVEKIAINGDKREFAYCAYTEKDKQLLRTCAIANGNYNYTILGNAVVKFSKGKIAEEMNRLAIDKADPLQVFYAEHIDSELPLEYERLSE